MAPKSPPASLDFETILYDVANGVAHVTLNRPDRRNGLSDQLLRELEAAILAADEDDAVKVVLLKGNGPAFCAGYDLAGARPYNSADTQGTDGPAGQEPGWDRLNRTLYDMRRDGEWWLKLFWNLRKPVVAQVHGACVAGANDLLAAVDIVIAAEDAKFSLPQARGIGVIHTMGLWPYYLGIRRAKELAFTGDAITGREAAELGMVNRAVPPSILAREAEWTAERIALMPRQMLMAHKFAINRFVELQGLELAVKGCGEYDAIAAQNWMNDKFRQITAADGLRAAVAWREKIWSDQQTLRPASD